VDHRGTPSKKRKKTVKQKGGGLRKKKKSAGPAHREREGKGLICNKKRD